MPDSSFADRLAARVEAVGTPTCVGLDPHLGRVPGTVEDLSPPSRSANVAAIREFCLRAIDTMAPHVAVVKPQSAFFEVLGAEGVALLQELIPHAQAAGLLVLLDAKRGDISSTATAYAQATVDPNGPMAADAVTLAPYLGPDSLEPFLGFPGRGAFVLLRTSNKGGNAWQRDHLWADAVAGWAALHAPTVGVVVGATVATDEVRQRREQLPDSWFLMPGYGAQGAGVEEVRKCFATGHSRYLITASRSVLFPKKDEKDTEDGLATRVATFCSEIRTAAG